MNGSDPNLPIPAILQYSAHDQPPAFLFVLHGWFGLFPFNDLSGRIVPVIFGIAGIGAIYWLGKETGGTRTGLVAAFLTSINYMHIVYSQEVRSYTLIVFLSALSYVFIIRALRTEGWSDFCGYILSTAILFYTHYYALVVIASQGILLLAAFVMYGTTRKFVTRAVISAITIVILCIPWIPVYFSNAKATSFWITQEPLYFPLKYFYIYFRDYFSTILFAVLLGWLILKSRPRPDQPMNRTYFILLGSVVLGYAIPYFYSLVRIPMLHVRYTLIILPALMVLISLGFGLIEQRWLMPLLALVAFTTIITLTFGKKHYTTLTKEDWRGITAKVSSRIKPGDLLVSPKAWYCNYYFRQQPFEIRAIEPQALNLTEDHAGIWWVDAFSLTPQPEGSEQRLRELGYQPVQTDSLFHARATYYRKP